MPAQQKQKQREQQVELELDRQGPIGIVEIIPLAEKVERETKM
jgi:hypothetical protein